MTLKRFGRLTVTAATIILLGLGLASAVSPLKAKASHVLPNEPSSVLQTREARSSRASCGGCYHDATIVESWSDKYFPDSFAGVFVSGGRLMVGYTSRQARRVRALKRLPDLIGPGRVFPFPYVPRFSLRRLYGLQKQILDDVMSSKAHEGLIVSAGVDVRENHFQWADGPDRVRTDGTAIRIKQGGIVPLAKWGWDGHALPTEPPGRARKGNVVCYSGAVSKNVSCGKIVARSLNHRVTAGDYAAFGLAGYWVRFPEDRRPVKGDSGSPVWNRRTGASIGLVSFGRPLGSFEETLVAPLLHPPNMPANRVPGILHHHGMEPLQLKLGG